MLLNHRELTVQDPDVVDRALGHFRKRPTLDFSDCLVVEAASSTAWLAGVPSRAKLIRGRHVA